MPAELADGLGLPSILCFAWSNYHQNAGSPAPLLNHEGIRRWSIGIHYTSLECKFKLNAVHMSWRDYMDAACARGSQNASTPAVKYFSPRFYRPLRLNFLLSPPLPDIVFLEIPLYHLLYLLPAHVPRRRNKDGPRPPTQKSRCTTMSGGSISIASPENSC